MEEEGFSTGDKAPPPKNTGAKKVSEVLFSRKISPEELVNIYKAAGFCLKGKVAVKLHSGEPGGHNFLQADFVKPIVDFLKGVIVECNTAYEGRRFKTEDHLRVMQEHGFAGIAPVDIMDSDGETALKISGGKQIDRKLATQLANAESVSAMANDLAQLDFFEEIKPALDDTNSLRDIVAALTKYHIKQAKTFSHLYPLSVIPVVDYMIHKENEVNNIRIIARGLDSGLDREVIRGLLVV